MSFSVRFFTLKARARNGQVPIYCRIVVNRKKAEFSISRTIESHRWDESKQRPKGNPELTAFVSSIESDLLSIHQREFMNGNSISAKEVKNKFLSDELSDVLLIDHFNGFINQISKLTSEYSVPTVKKYKTIQRHLKSFLGVENQRSIRLSDFNVQQAYKFEQFLMSESGLSRNTTTKYLKQLNAIFNRAVKLGLILRSPFNGFKFKYQPTTRIFLDQKDIDSLETVSLENESLSRVRDVFLFSVYSGLRYSDVLALRRRNFTKDKNGQWIQFVSQKTKEQQRVPMLNKAMSIVDKYTSEAEITGKVLPVISNQKINAYLKVLADLAGIEKKLTFHVARHTFATTITLSNNIPIEIVKEFLGHKKMSTTQIYAQITNQYLAESAIRLNEILAQ